MSESEHPMSASHMSCLLHGILPRFGLVPKATKPKEDDTMIMRCIIEAPIASMQGLDDEDEEANYKNDEDDDEC